MSAFPLTSARYSSGTVVSSREPLDTRMARDGADRILGYACASRHSERAAHERRLQVRSWHDAIWWGRTHGAHTDSPRAVAHIDLS
ncbi:MAG: hypothetical protein ACREKM_13550, partial [Longimicrobiales bacterium]